MGHDARASFLAAHGRAVGISVLLLLVIGAILLSTEISLRGEMEGIYLLHGVHKPFEIRTDIFLDEEQRLIASLTFTSSKRFLSGLGPQSRRQPPFIEYTWDESSGDGYAVSHLKRGGLIVINWSRFLDDSGRAPSGLFLGGNMPFPVNPPAATTLSATGMAYFDGRRWFHGWCSVNELLSPASDTRKKIHPHEWEFLGSRVLSAGEDHLLITSRHRARVGGVPILIQKWVFLRAGDLYFTMATRMENEGKDPAGYYYLYGDEPWVGNYGSSRGNVGWTSAGLVHYEGFVDTATTDFVGFYDIGNSVIDERGPFTRTANFLQWFHSDTPELVYFTNMAHPLRPPWNTVPLASRQTRALFLQWGPQILPPRGVKTYLIATGMIPPGTWANLPEKPWVVPDPRLLRLLVGTKPEPTPAGPAVVPAGTEILLGP